MKPYVCVPCGLFFKIVKNGVFIEEGMPVETPQGKEWRPYKLWSGDRWQCRGCGAEIVAGFGVNAIAEHYQADYTTQVERFKPAFRVDDC